MLAHAALNSSPGDSETDGRASRRICMEPVTCAWRSRTPRSLCLGLAGLLLVVTGCVSATTDPTADVSGNASMASTPDTSTQVSEVETEALDSLDRAMEQAFGYTLSDIQWAFDRAVADLIADCMISRGWEYERSAPERFDPSSIERHVAGEQARIDLERREAAAEADTEEPPEFGQDENQCWQNAIDKVPDPASEAQNWLSSQTEGLYDRVSSDPRVIDAEVTEERCIAGAGYDAATLNDTRNGFTDQADAILMAVRQGTLDREAALEALEKLATEERRISDATDPCIDARVQVERTVARELEAQWLEDHGDQLAVAIAQLEDDVDQLSDELEAISAGS